MTGHRPAHGAVALAPLLLLLAACGSEPAPTPAAAARTGFAFTSAAIDLPAEEQPFPDGPHADLVTANCTACHSASMVLNQPRLKPEQWAATVKKMREVYRAPVADRDVPAILAYLTALPQQRAGTD